MTLDALLEYEIYFTQEDDDYNYSLNGRGYLNIKLGDVKVKFSNINIEISNEPFINENTITWNHLYIITDKEKITHAEFKINKYFVEDIYSSTDLFDFDDETMRSVIKDTLNTYYLPQ